MEPLTTTRIIQICTTTALLTLLAMGCSGKPRQTRTELRINQLAIDVIGGRSFVTTPDLTRYIEEHGTDGWIMGLSQASPVMQFGDHDQIAESSFSRKNYPPLRVKDVVYLYYQQTHGAAERSDSVMQFGAYHERDVKISNLLAELQHSETD